MGLGERPQGLEDGTPAGTRAHLGARATTQANPRGSKVGPVLCAAAMESTSEPAVLRWKRLLRPVLVLAALGFIGLAVLDLSRRWEPAELELDGRWLLAAVVPALLAPLLQAWGWVRLIEHSSGRSVPFGPALELYLDSQLARYTPGKVGLPAVRMAGAERLGVSARSVGASILVELLSWLAVGGGVGLVFVFVGVAVPDGLLQTVARFGGVLLLLATLAVLVLLVVDRSRFPAPLRRLLLIDGQGPLLPPALPLAHVAHWLSWGVHGSFLALALGASLPTALTAGGVLCMAIVVGFLALFAPAGAGVREALIGVGVAPLLGAPVAVALGVLARALSIFSDVSVWVAVRGFGRVRRRVAGRSL